MSNTTPSSWLNFMWTLHNKVRNGRGVKLTGLGALNEINNFLLLFFIERNFEKYTKLDDTCRFSYIYEHFCSPKAIKEDEEEENKSKKTRELNLHKKLFIHYSDASNMQCVLRKLLSDPDIRSYLKNEVTSISAYTDSVETGKTIQDVITYIYDHFQSIAKDKKKSIEKLTLDDFGFDAFGDAYEKFKQQSCEDSGKTTGQHFTPDLVKDYIIKEMDPKDNEIFYEPACGTGGFIHKSMKYIKNKGGNYKKFCEKLMANECNPEIYKPLAINMLIHDIPIDNIGKQDSLNLNYGYRVKNKFDVCLTNPPFGGNDMVEPDVEYWGPLQSGKTVIKKAMAQFLIHIYNSMKVGGRVGTVSDRGIINNSTDGKNSWTKTLRKFLLENTNLYRIVLLPKETFDYTTFATCILFFKKGEKTKEVEFRELKFKETTVDGIKTFIIDPDSDKAIIKVPISKIIDKNYSLQLDDYIDKPDKKKKTGDKWIELGKVCNITSGKAINKENRTGNKYPYFASNGIIGYIDDYTHDDKNYVICAQDGTIGSTHYHNGRIWASNHVWVLNSTKINNKYLYYLMKIFVNYDNLITGNAIPKLTKYNIENILIPNLPLVHQEEIIKFLDEQFTIHDINKIKKSTPIFDLLIKKEYQLAEDLIYMIYRQIDMEEQVEKIKKDRFSMFNMLITNNKIVFKKLDKVVKVVRGKSLPKSKIVNGDYPVIGGGAEYSGYHNEFNYDAKNSIFISRVGSAGHVSKYENKCYITDLVFTLEPLKINKNYLYLYLKTYQNSIQLLRAENAAPNISWSKLKNFKIKVPSIDDQEKILKKLEDYNKITEPIIKYAETMTKDLETYMEGIKKYCEKEEDYESESDSDSSSNYSDSDNESSKSTIKSKKTKSKQDDNTSNKSTKSSKSEEIIVKPRTTKSKKDLESDDEIVSIKKSKSKKVEKLTESDSDDEPVKPKSKTKLSKSKVEEESPAQTKNPTKKSTSKKTVKVESESESETSESEEEKPKSKAKTVTTKSKSKTKSKNSDDELDDLEKELTNNK